MIDRSQRCFRRDANLIAWLLWRQIRNVIVN